jgi:hypothetical protein
MHAALLTTGDLISEVWHSLSGRISATRNSAYYDRNDIDVTDQWGAGFPSSIHLFVNSMPSSLALCAVSKARPMQLNVRMRLMPSLSQHTTTLNFHRLPLLVGSSMR